MARLQSVVQGRRGFRLDANNFDAICIPAGDATDESASTDGDKERVKIRRLLLELEPYRALAKKRFGLIVGVNGQRAGFGGPAFAGGEGIGIAFSGYDKFRTTAADAFDFFPGSDGGDKNLCRHCEFHGREGNGGAVIAAGSGGDTRLGDFSEEQICKSATRFE
jgi:hypothetical protein